MSIFQRKRDLLYLIFFLIHVPVMFCVDLVPIYPEHLRPQFITDLRKYYIATYNDQFFVNPPAWFSLYMWFELLYHLPVTIWAIGGLLRDDPKVPVHLLVFGMETLVTTGTCVADYLSWSNFSDAQKVELSKLYVPYLALSVFMTVDMFQRLTSSIGRTQVSGSKKRQ